MLIAVLADTHIKRTGVRRLSASVYHRLEAADAILHAGDVVVAEVIDDLARFAPVHAVRGNNDHELPGLPHTLETSLGGVAVAMIHDAGAAAGRERRMRRMFPSARVVVFGHSHIPVSVRVPGGPLLLNPGSPTDKRRQPAFTIAMLRVGDGTVRSARIVAVDGR